MLQKIKNSPKNFWGIFALSLLLNVSFIPNLHAAPTDLDPSFGTGGVAQISFSQPSSQAGSMLIQGDKIILGGYSQAASLASNTSKFALARLNLSNGTLDNSFDGDGKVETPFVDSGATVPGTNGGAQIAKIALTPNGKIMAGGTFYPSAGSSFTESIALARYDSNGAIDIGFAVPSGTLVYNFVRSGVSVNAVAVQGASGNGDVIVAGEGATPTDTNPQIFSARFDERGLPDVTAPAYGPTGTGATMSCCGAPPPNSAANAIAVIPGQKVVLAGSVNGSAHQEMLVSQLDSNGAPLGLGGSGGIARIPFTDKDATAKAVLVQTDGKIVVAGNVSSVTAGAINSAFALARLNADGSPDTGFGTAGKVETPFSKPLSMATSIALQSDSKFVVAGFTMGGTPSSASIALARYNPNGTLDTSFGNGGKFEMNVGTNSGASSVAIQSDGKILLAGATSTAADFSDGKMFALRLMGPVAATPTGATPPGGGGSSGGGCNLSQLVTTTPWVNLIWVVGLLGFGILRRKSK